MRNPRARSVLWGFQLDVTRDFEVPGYCPATELIIWDFLGVVKLSDLPFRREESA